MAMKLHDKVLGLALAGTVFAAPAATLANNAGNGTWFESLLSKSDGNTRIAVSQQSDPSLPTFDNGGAEWSDRFDPSSDTLSFTFDSRQPTLSAQTVANIQTAIDTYMTIAGRGGWGQVPGGQVLRVGLSHKNVAALRARLIASGDLNAAAGVSNTFDTYVEAAVRRFQARHGLLPDGMVRDETLAELNVPVDVRIAQLRTNLVRVQAMSADLGDRYVMVNIPAAEVEAVENGTVASRHTAVVGRKDRQSPILTKKVLYVSFNPYWTVPKSIIRKDIIPKMREDPEYLTRYKIRILNGKGDELDPSQVDWNTNEAVDYMLKQDPGDQNSLGSIRINFPNKDAVYLHDTPQQTLFGQNARFHSSGCVRVQNVRQLVDWLLQPNGDWSRTKIDAVVRSGERIDVSLRKATPIYFAYITAWATSDGVVHFRPDIYDRDGPGAPLASDI
ncbi:L,D-transpeptidase family protein [Microbaculum sp. FT89]|uniref:L,D-transpeptidase family protein n=1 Tax=Microbaculum sp. FT89 TaxID=3447298 RepID=UPI003F533286